MGGKETCGQGLPFLKKYATFGLSATDEVLAMGLILRLDYLALAAAFALLGGILIGAF
jgi:hypothetical protein